MAYLLQRLIAGPGLLLGAAAAVGGALLASPPPPDRPFSHRAHLALKLECLSCHPTAASSVKAGDNNLPDAKLCAQCHEGGSATVKPQPRKLLVDHFPHKLHLGMGNLAPVIAEAIDSGAYLGPVPPGRREALNTANRCAACHRGIETSAAVSAANFPVMADCLVCHTKVDPPFSCTKCHVDSPALKPAAIHPPDFLESHSRQGALKEKESCAVCHGRRFTCLGCHSGG